MQRGRSRGPLEGIGAEVRRGRLIRVEGGAPRTGPEPAQVVRELAEPIDDGSTFLAFCPVANRRWINHRSVLPMEPVSPVPRFGTCVMGSEPIATVVHPGRTSTCNQDNFGKCIVFRAIIPVRRTVRIVRTVRAVG